MGRNSRYSLRAFAKHLGVGPSTLSQILNQKRSLSDKMCEKLAAPLGLSPHRMRHLMQREPGPLPDAASAFPNFLKIEEDRFHFITDWYYYTILELTRVEDFKPKISWIAKPSRHPSGGRALSGHAPQTPRLPDHERAGRVARRARKRD